MTISPHRKVGIFFVFTTRRTWSYSASVNTCFAPIVIQHKKNLPACWSGAFLFRTSDLHLAQMQHFIVSHKWSAFGTDATFYCFAPVLHAKQLILHATAKCKCQICEANSPNACAVASVPSVRNNKLGWSQRTPPPLPVRNNSLDYAPSRGEK